MRKKILFLMSGILMIESATAQEYQSWGELLEGAELSNQVVTAAESWAEEKACTVSEDAKQQIAQELIAVTPVFSQRAEEFSSDNSQVRSDIEHVTVAYLDLIKQEFLYPDLQPCNLDANFILRLPISELDFGVDTGRLVIDGDQAGADIRINGDLKGQIRGTFVLSVGQHTWEAMNCSGIEEILAYQTVERHCSD